jgi:hypothetical protein
MDVSCKHTILELVQSTKFSGEYGAGHDAVYLCQECGVLRVVGARNGETFEVEFHIPSREMLNLMGRWIDQLEST